MGKFVTAKLEVYCSIVNLSKVLFISLDVLIGAVGYNTVKKLYFMFFSNRILKNYNIHHSQLICL